MPTITILPNDSYCPQGMTIEAKPGDSILAVLLQHGITIEHACEMQCACTTCHIYVRQGHASLNSAEEKEDEMLDRAWGLDMDSRLSCQVIVGQADIVIEIPKYTLNQVAERSE